MKSTTIFNQKAWRRLSDILRLTYGQKIVEAVVSVTLTIIDGTFSKWHIGLNRKKNNFKISDFLVSMGSLKSNLHKHTI